MRDVGARPGVRADRGRRGRGRLRLRLRAARSKFKAGNNKAHENKAAGTGKKRGFDSSRRNRNKILDAPYIACNADFNIQPNFRQELEQKLMAPADHRRLGCDVIMRDGEHTGIMVPSSQRRRAKVRSARSPSSPTSAAGPGGPHLLVRIALTSIETLVAQARIALITALTPPS
jgi:hypothetical protein